MTLFARRTWREDVRTVGLGQRLVAAACPISLREVLATAGLRNATLTQWARSSMHQRVMLRSAQSERLARGQSLEEIAAGTGITVDQVIYYLTRFEWEFADEPTIVNFYNSPNGDLE